MIGMIFTFGATLPSIAAPRHSLQVLDCGDDPTLIAMLVHAKMASIWRGVLPAYPVAEQ